MRQKTGVSTSLFLSLIMAVTANPVLAKSSPRHDSNASTTETANSTLAPAADRNTDPTQEETTATRVRHERRHSSGKRRGVIIGGTALTGMLVGAGVAGPVGAVAGAGVGAGVGLFLSHIF